MNSLRASEYNLRRREQLVRESLDERFQRRSARNSADRLRRARARSDQQMANRVNSEAETNVSEHDCVMMTEICNFCQALYWRNELNSSNKIAPLYSNERFKPGYGQLYIFDDSEANSRRLENNPSCLSSVMEKLDALLRTIKPYAESYLQMHQLIQWNPTVNIKMIFMEHPDLDMRRYNAPTSRTEVAAIFVGDDGEPPANRDICIYPIG
ncbi:hypothetical protein AVEN_148020-1 [Araneus ventricosus]|uniref:Helitron helicase-like domain-containing protein n=1 Tax=Araneus ventricosus TaxID=182803 RepID=A0A4Y2U164_ARAVE|nr:hypothetical protein AVEN_148020-1 [Araneus ventricosus]